METYKDCKVDMEQLRQIELKLFLEFLKICSKYELKYFLLGGSCLGAVRHQGFIPWDDDIDIGMPRNDYNKFMEVAQSELSEHIFVQNGKTDDNYPMSFAKLRDSSTTFLETTMRNFEMNQGVFIDIFPLDGYEYSKVKEIKYHLCKRRVKCEYYFPDLKERMKLKIQKGLLMIILPDYRKARDKREIIMQSVPYEDSKLVFNYCGAWGKKELVPREYFGNGCKGIFEGIEVNLPENYDGYLTSLYGKYMEFPPVEKRVAHHYCDVIDLHQSYKKYCAK